MNFGADQSSGVSVIVFRRSAYRFHVEKKASEDAGFSDSGSSVRLEQPYMVHYFQRGKTATKCLAKLKKSVW